MASERGYPRKKLEFFEVGLCETAFEMGFLIGKRFSDLIQSRISSDLILRQHLLPFARRVEAKPLLNELCDNNRRRFPRYELVGTAEGSDASVLDLVLLNVRKEILPFIFKTSTPSFQEDKEAAASNDYSVAVVACKEDGNIDLIGHSFTHS